MGNPSRNGTSRECTAPYDDLEERAQVELAVIVPKPNPPTTINHARPLVCIELLDSEPLTEK